MSAEQLALISKHSDWKTFVKGQVIYSNEPDDQRGSGRIYAVQKGEVLITKSGDEQRDITLATFVAGESFGELSLFDNRAAVTSARCEEDTILLVFPGEGDPQRAAAQAETLFREHPQIKATILRNLLTWWLDASAVQTG